MTVDGSGKDLSRFVFTQRSQKLHPLFWKELNQAWRSGDPAEIAGWMHRHGVVDQWLRDIAAATVNAWSCNPVSAAAWLYEGASWFPEDTFTRVPFTPAIDDQPRYGRESLAEYGVRVRRQFEQQLRAWTARRREDGAGVLESAAELRACEWTVLHFAGVRYVDLAAGLPLAYADPEQTVRRAVVRFAGKIGLTLNSTRKGRNVVLPNERRHVA